MAEEIRQASVITDEESERLFKWGADIFGLAPYTVTFRKKDVHFFMDVDNEPMSHVGILKHEVSVGGTPLTIAGLGGVVTRPEAQGKGYARRLIERAVEFFGQEWKVEAGLLFCLPQLERYYASLGWQPLKETVLIEQPSGQIKMPFRAMVFPCQGRPWPAGEVELRSLPW